MPIYDYLCTACDHRADILHGINDPGPHFCPSCGAEGTMRKQFSAPTIHFKGSGWAKKDRGGSSGATRASTANHGDSTESKSETPSSGSGESSSTASASSSESKD
jgi:putative FmdB family regulatory protein